MNTHKIINIPGELESTIAGRDQTVARAVADDLSSYYALLDMIRKDLKDRFTKYEAALLCEIFKNTEMQLERLREWPVLFAWDVEEVEKYEKLSQRYGVDPDVLMEKLEDLLPHQALWLWDRIKQYWRQYERLGTDKDVFEVDFDIL